MIAPVALPLVSAVYPTWVIHASSTLRYTVCPVVLPSRTTSLFCQFPLFWREICRKRKKGEKFLEMLKY
jgi:hypothetical protein